MLCTTRIENIKDFDLGQIAESGQCFRMNYIGKGKYSIVAFGKYIEISQHDNTLILLCEKNDYQKIWNDYFDFGTNYSIIKENAKSDDFLNQAIKYGSGIRILKQDLWETLVTFIISQRKSIPSIKQCVETLCIQYGERIVQDGIPIKQYSFPTAETLSCVPVEDLRSCGLGYRDVYVSKAAKWFCKNKGLITPNTPYTYAKNILMQIEGVGDKVANCVCLFGLHKLEACPIDIHMKQIIDGIYFGIMPEWMASDKAGVLQQYAFYYKKNYMRGM